MRTQEINRLEVRDAVRDDIQQHLDWLDTDIKQLVETINDHIDHHLDFDNSIYRTKFASITVLVRPQPAHCLKLAVLNWLLFLLAIARNHA
jgi:hypothetical protein